MKPLEESCRSRREEAQISKELEHSYGGSREVGALTTELLILPNGQILVHNLTQPFAELLAELNPNCEQINSRITDHSSPPHEFPN